MLLVLHCFSIRVLAQEKTNVRDPVSASAIRIKGPKSALDPNSNEPLEHVFGNGAARVHYWWNQPGTEVYAQSLRNGSRSNVRFADYAGPDACKDCHQENYEKWSKHSHRLMNAMARPETVVGDFSGNYTMDYLGGKAGFYTLSGTNYHIRLERNGVKRDYKVNRTIGSRFFQYYVGVLNEGPESTNHLARKEDHVLPLGYWIDRKQWVPIVHVDDEKPDGQREDPFATVSDIHYDRNCSICHTTWPIGDWLLTVAGMNRLQNFSPFSSHFLLSDYVRENHPEVIGALTKAGTPKTDLVPKILEMVNEIPVKDHAVALGITCESCHNGSKSHAESSTTNRTSINPLFFPASPSLLSQGPTRAEAWGKRPQNLNWTCSRCHSGGRPSFANGSATWNSVEYADAVNGSCYIKDPGKKSNTPNLTCVHCHNPHQGIGPKWTRTPREDNAKCTACHKQFEDKTVRLAHTHHKEGTEGDDCMNCHMPKINEGLQDMVRTHTIFSPTQPAMLEANQPNACNLCHLKETLGWTLSKLKEWYPAKAPAGVESKMVSTYGKLDQPMGELWLQSTNEHTRLVGAEALIRTKSTWALPGLLQVLDDPFLMNRQFTQRRLEELLQADFSKQGYRFYQTKAERVEPIRKIREALLKNPPRLER